MTLACCSSRETRRTAQFLLSTGGLNGFDHLSGRQPTTGGPFHGGHGLAAVACRLGRLARGRTAFIALSWTRLAAFSSFWAFEAVGRQRPTKMGMGTRDDWNKETRWRSRATQ